ncbi:S1 family peptidase [Rubritalea tangerina]|uniref:Serine protease n=1 Tax=Rubritalea tangerina TaxID=430798 RepID=A0ABW4Z957_9BACT
MRLFRRSILFLGLSVRLLAEAPVVIDDRALSIDFGDRIGAMVDAGQTTSAKDLGEQLKRERVAIELAEARKEISEDVYGGAVDSVGIIASVYKCGRCDDWHRSGAATCWVLSADGVMVTNYHVFANAEHSGWGVLTRDGKVSAVKEILAANKEMDIAIFKVAGEGYKPLSFGEASKVGGDAHIIAHPDGRFFTYTYGKVSRYYRTSRRGVVWMAVTAEFARGSSGGPVIDSRGNVIGMVANTQSIYYTSEKKGEGKGPFQMVIRNCVPVESMLSLIEKE